MKKILLLALSLGALVSFTGCGERVRIEQGQVAKIMDTNGLEKEVRSTSILRLDSCAFSACPKLVTLDITKNSQTIPGKFFMPKSDMELGVEMKIQYKAKTDNKSIDLIFKDVPSSAVSNYINSISSLQLFQIYIDPVIRDSARQALGNYKIEEVMSNLEVVRKFVQDSVNKKLVNSPVEISSLSFSSITWPELILKKKEEFAAIDTQKATDMKAMGAELEILAKKLELEKKKALMQLEVDNIVSKQMDEGMVAWGIVQAIQTSAENGTPWSLGGGALPMMDLKTLKKQVKSSK